MLPIRVSAGFLDFRSGSDMHSTSRAGSYLVKGSMSIHPSTWDVPRLILCSPTYGSFTITSKMLLTPGIHLTRPANPAIQSPPMFLSMHAQKNIPGTSCMDRGSSDATQNLTGQSFRIPDITTRCQHEEVG